YIYGTCTQLPERNMSNIIYIITISNYKRASFESLCISEALLESESVLKRNDNSILVSSVCTCICMHPILYAWSLGHGNYVNNLRSNAVRELDRRNVEKEKTVDVEGPTVNKVEKIHWYIKDNAKLHHTAKFDQIHDPTNPQPVLRRGQTFYMAIRLKDRDFDLEVDRLVLNFKFGSRPSVTKRNHGSYPCPYNKF
ncbi:Hemocyte protein-glutamine gamma-glutamyltransferase, partial [Armadillidium vulgare]